MKANATCDKCGARWVAGVARGGRPAATARSAGASAGGLVVKDEPSRTQSQQDALDRLASEHGHAIARLQNDGMLWVQFGRLGQHGARAFLVSPAGKVVQVYPAGEVRS